MVFRQGVVLAVQPRQLDPLIHCLPQASGRELIAPARRQALVLHLEWKHDRRWTSLRHGLCIDAVIFTKQKTGDAGPLQVAPSSAGGTVLRLGRQRSARKGPPAELAVCCVAVVLGVLRCRVLHGDKHHGAPLLHLQERPAGHQPQRQPPGAPSKSLQAARRPGWPAMHRWPPSATHLRRPAARWCVPAFITHCAPRLQVSKPQPVVCMAKKGLHPEWHDEAKVFCNGEEVLVTSGTKGSYTGAQGAPQAGSPGRTAVRRRPLCGGPPSRAPPAAALRRVYVPCPPLITALAPPPPARSGYLVGQPPLLPGRRHHGGDRRGQREPLQAAVRGAGQPGGGGDCQLQGGRCQEAVSRLVAGAAAARAAAVPRLDCLSASSVV